MDRRRFLHRSSASVLAPALASAGSALISRPAPAASAGSGSPDGSLVAAVERTTLRRNRDGEGTTWFHPKVAMVPAGAGEREALMCLQPIEGSDYFAPVQWCRSTDLGATWTDPVPLAPLGRVPVPGHDGLEEGVCDVVPHYHPESGTVLALGQSVFYRGPRFSLKEQLTRFPTYTARRADGSWSERKQLRWDDPGATFGYSNNCGQRVNLPGGDILLALSVRSSSSGKDARKVRCVRCTFDGETLAIAKAGPALANDTGRGLLEPSLTSFGGRFFLTLRAEDERGYVSTSEDGLRFEPQKPWTWDDGEPLAMSTTQQHWLTHSDALYLVYTRQSEANSKVIRWRSPLRMARVDPEKLRLIRETERTVFPLVGDPENDPDGVALMGNFHPVTASADESWITVGEWMPRRGARGDLLLARVRWAKPNGLAGEWTVA